MNRYFDSSNFVSVGEICLSVWFIGSLHYLLKIARKAPEQILNTFLNCSI